jgi:hypothetical protein
MALCQLRNGSRTLRATKLAGSPSRPKFRDDSQWNTDLKDMVLLMFNVRNSFDGWQGTILIV